MVTEQEHTEEQPSFEELMEDYLITNYIASTRITNSRNMTAEQQAEATKKAAQLKEQSQQLFSQLNP